MLPNVTLELAGGQVLFGQVHCGQLLELQPLLLGQAQAVQRHSKSALASERITFGFAACLLPCPTLL